MNDNPEDRTPLTNWSRLRALTPARIGLGHRGASMPVDEVQRFGLAHAKARDAVHEPFRAGEIAAALAAPGRQVIEVASAAGDRATYLRRPDLGRMLSQKSRAMLASHSRRSDLALVVADGLSATAIHNNALPLVTAVLAHIEGRAISCAPIVVASQARVALGDEIGHLLGARMVLMLIGERPGLSSPDSLGAYLTFAPRPGVSDAARNCLSDIRPAGLSFEVAAAKLDWLIDEAFRRSLTGIDLKDDSDALLLTKGAARLPNP